jgi:hypothetical protein
MSVQVGSARLPWDVVVDDPVGASAADRAALGDTFVVESGGMRYLLVSPPMECEHSTTSMN